MVTTVLVTRGDDDPKAGSTGTQTSGAESTDGSSDTGSTSPSSSPTETTEPAQPSPSILGTLTLAEEKLLGRISALDLGPCYSNTEQSVEVFGARLGVACDLPVGRASTLTLRKYATPGRADDAWLRFATEASESEECGVGNYEGSYQGMGHRGRLRCSDAQHLSTGKVDAIVSWTDGDLFYNALAPSEDLHALVVSYFTPLCVCNPP